MPAERSLADLRAAVEQDPHDAGRFCELAFGYLRAGERKQALDAALRAAQLKPRGGEALGCLAQVHLARHETDEAQATVDRGLAANQRDPNLHVIAARIAEARGDQVAALAAVSRALSHSSRHPPARAELRRIAPLRVSPILLASSTSTIADAVKRYPGQPDLVHHLDVALRFVLVRLALLTVAGALIASIVLARGTDAQAGLGCLGVVALLAFDSGVFLARVAKPGLVRLRSQVGLGGGDGDGEFRRAFALQVLALVALLVTPALPGTWQAVATAVGGFFAAVAMADLVLSARDRATRSRVSVSSSIFQWTVMILLAMLAIAGVIVTKSPIAGAIWIVVILAWGAGLIVDWMRLSHSN